MLVVLWNLEPLEAKVVVQFLWCSLQTGLQRDSLLIKQIISCSTSKGNFRNSAPRHQREMFHCKTSKWTHCCTNIFLVLIFCPKISLFWIELQIKCCRLSLDAGLRTTLPFIFPHCWNNELLQTIIQHVNNMNKYFFMKNIFRLQHNKKYLRRQARKVQEQSRLNREHQFHPQGKWLIDFQSMN